MIRVTFLIRSLETGGAERQLVALARGLDRSEFAVTVLTFYPRGPLGSELAEAGVRLVSLDKAGRWDLLGFLGRLRQALRESEADIVHSYLTTPNLMTLAVRSALPGAKLVWGKRASAMEMAHYDFWTGATEWLEARLACRPDLIVLNAEAGRRDYLARGAHPRRLEVVPNGIDVARFRPRPEARPELRAAWGVPDDALLVGMIARIDPMKGHAVFLEAAAEARRARPELRFVFIGGGIEELAAELRARAEDLGLGDALVWAGERGDVAEALSSLDLHCSASVFGEGFSNATGEAMAAGLPCAVTDVGDSALIVGETGWVVPPGDPAALARAWLEALAEDRETRRARGARARDRIVERFSLKAMVARTAALYRGLLAGGA